MKLSHNWTSLIGSTEKSKKKVHLKEHEKKGYVSKNVTKKKPKSKIMDMVYNINKEIEKQKDNKQQGKEFAFKVSKEVIKLDTVEKTKPNAKNQNDIGKFVAIDCEFVGVGPEGKQSVLARVSMVNFHGNVILDKFVRPRETVTDWRTWVSGIKPEHMKDAVSFKVVQKEVAKILENRILVGHAVKHDLEALMLSHPRSKIVDTSRYLPFRQQFAKGKSPSLKKLAKEILKVEIQDGQHSSIEDAKATMLIYKSVKKEFDQERRKKYGN